MKSTTKISSILPFSLWVLVVFVVVLSAAFYSNEINANLATQSGPKTTTVSPRSFSLPFSLNSAGNVVIPGLYDSLGGIITPIQGQAQFRRLVLGLETDDEAQNQQRNHTHVKLNQQQVANEIRQAAMNQTISLVQFYMATCPDCQGFSPYFKRFAQSIEPHWRKLVRIYTVNCNDFLNIHLCQEENPKLIVPMVRWYVMPIIQMDAQTHKYNFDYSKNLLNIAHRQFIEKQRRDMISLRRATLKFINLMMDELLRHKVARRSNQTGSSSADGLLLDSLPLRWHSLEQLGARPAHDEEGLVVSSTPRNVRHFIDDLNGRTRQCVREAPGGGGGGQDHKSMLVRNFVVFESRRSLIGRTLVADWSDITCSVNLRAVIHHTSDLLLLRQLRRANSNSSIAGLNSALPILLGFNSTSGPRLIDQLDELQFTVLAANETDRPSREHRPKRHAHYQRPERLQQRASLQRFYTRSQPPFRYANSMVSGGRRRRKRHSTMRGNETELTLAKLRAQAEAENINWAPEMLYPDEERLRFEFNQRIRKELNLNLGNLWWPPGLAEGNPGEIVGLKPNVSAIIQPKDDDLMLLLLTDYYRGLDEIIHVDLLSKGEVDYHQLLASSCFLRELIRYFPFQGNVLAADRHVLRYSGDEQATTTTTTTTTGAPHQVKQSSKSIARHYLQLIRMSYSAEVERQLGPGYNLMCSSLRSTSLNNNNTLTFSRLNDNPNKLPQVAGGANHTGGPLGTNTTTTTTTSNRLGEFKIKTRHLESKLAEIRRNYDVGLPGAENFGWKYCVGSNNYLRGHTCSLWILFHTLTVHEYLERLDELESSSEVTARTPRLARAASVAENSSSLRTATTTTTITTVNETTEKNLSSFARPAHQVASSASKLVASSGSESVVEKQAPSESQLVARGEPKRHQEQYEFQIDYSRPPRRHCDPRNPDEALLASSTGELFVNQTQYVLANIINFVRFYLPCTNCAAHFSCMVEHSVGLSFAPANEPDSHLLWLWEGHNRVNERTKGSHSEDPTRPKHIFPVYEACPQCYLEKPASNTTAAAFGSMRFNRRELVKFLVARYQRSAILNNKINIEDLYKKT